MLGIGKNNKASTASTGNVITVQECLKVTESNMYETVETRVLKLLCVLSLKTTLPVPAQQSLVVSPAT